MKNLVIYSEESIFSGNISCGIAEVVDSLGNSLTSEYNVSIVCKAGNMSLANSLTEFDVTLNGV
jgi:hypothetical protein